MILAHKLKLIKLYFENYACKSESIGVNVFALYTNNPGSFAGTT